MRHVFATMTKSNTQSKGLNLALWVVQTLLAVTFVGTGVWKLLTPVADLAAKMPWMGEVSPAFLHTTAVLDLLGGVGVFLPSATGIAPRLSALAALGCVGLMASAIVFHLQRGEAASTPFNVVMAALSAIVAWGRYASAPISRR